MKKILISPETLDLSVVQQLLNEKVELELSAASREKIIRCRTFLDEKITTGKDSIYGVNTGFGALHDKNISTENLAQLQKRYNRLHLSSKDQPIKFE